MTRTLRSSPRGLSLIEVMIAFAILTVGMLAILQLHILGMNSNNGGRMQTVGTHLASELVAGLETLAFSDALVSPTSTTGPYAPYTGFGRLVDATGAVNATGAHEWSDASPVPGVRLATQVPAEFARRWTVWGYSPTGGGTPTVKVVAVSVVWNEPSFVRPREVVLYTQLFNQGVLLSNITVNP